jgi:hypothetical protein
MLFAKDVLKHWFVAIMGLVIGVPWDTISAGVLQTWF